MAAGCPGCGGLTQDTSLDRPFASCGRRHSPGGNASAKPKACHRNTPMAHIFVGVTGASPLPLQSSSAFRFRGTPRLCLRSVSWESDWAFFSGSEERMLTMGLCRLARIGRGPRRRAALGAAASRSETHPRGRSVRQSACSPAVLTLPPPPQIVLEQLSRSSM